MTPRTELRPRSLARIRARRRKLVAAALLLLALFLISFAVSSFRHPRCGRHVRLAVSIQASETSVSQIPRLLDAIWDSCNVYAVHLDAKIAPADRNSLAETMLSKYQHNIRIVPSHPVAYAGVSMLLATLDSISVLLAERSRVPWSFFINISASDYPLVSASSLRALLSEPALKGLNFFQPQKSTRPESWFFQRRFATLHIDPTLWGFGGDLMPVDVPHPAAHPEALPLKKAEGWVILSVDFAAHAVDSTDARRLLALLANSRASDEHYFPTLLALSSSRFPVAWDALRHIVWGNATAAFPRPAFLDGPQHLELHHGLMNSGAIFARKFSTSHSSILDEIDSALAGRWRSVPATAQLLDSVRGHQKRVLRRALCIGRFRDGADSDSQEYAGCMSGEGEIL